MQKDHGYNPPPVWTVMGHFWSSLHPADRRLPSSSSRCFDLALLRGHVRGHLLGVRLARLQRRGDLLGLPAARRVLLDGRRVPASGLALLPGPLGVPLRKRYFALGGAAFAYSTLLRVVPGPAACRHGPWSRLAYALEAQADGAAPPAASWLGGLAATVAARRRSASASPGGTPTPSFTTTSRSTTTRRSPTTWGSQTVLVAQLRGPHGVRARREARRPVRRLEADAARSARTRSARFTSCCSLGARRSSSSTSCGASSRCGSRRRCRSPSSSAFVEVTCYYYSMFILVARSLAPAGEASSSGSCASRASASSSPSTATFRITTTTATRRSRSLFCLFAITLLVAYWPAQKKAAKAPVAASKTETPALGGASSRPASAAAEKPAV